MKRYARILQSIPIFTDPNTASAQLGRAQAQARYPFLRKAEDKKGTIWFEITYNNTQAWIVAESGRTYAEVVSGKENEGVPSEGTQPPKVPDNAVLTPWSAFTDLFPSYAPQTYQLSDSQMPFPPWKRSIASKYIGQKVTNCTNVQVSLVTQAMQCQITDEQYGWWQVYASSQGSGYSPQVMVDQGRATAVEDPSTTAPKNGVYLVQHFSEWPKGHNYLVIDFDEASGSILTCEATSVLELDGFGWRGLGNFRDLPNPGADWAATIDKTSGTNWWKLRGDYPICTMARLHVDHATVKAWLAKA